MKLAIRKTSDENYVDFKDFNTIEDLVNFMNKYNTWLVLYHNWAYKSNPQNCVTNKMNLEQATLFVSCEYEIQIYDE